MSQYLGYQEQPAPRRKPRGIAGPAFVTLLAVMAGLFVTGVFEMPRGLLNLRSGEGTTANANLEVEVGATLADGGTCHVVCVVDYHRTHSVDDQAMERLRPRLQRITSDLIKDRTRAELEKGSGVAEVESELLARTTELAKGVAVIALRVSGIRFED